MKASNRQRKFLSFFGRRPSPDISAADAGRAIGAIKQDEECQERWERYLYLTKDFDTDSPDPRPFDEAELQAVELPEDWSESGAMQEFKDGVVGGRLADASPFDQPPPPVEFTGRTFVFTGEFSFDTRKGCEEPTIARGGTAPSKSVSRKTDYLVIGTRGSPAWKRGSYGSKIEKAIVLAKEHGKPAIISEDHWVAQMKSSP